MFHFLKIAACIGGGICGFLLAMNGFLAWRDSGYVLEGKTGREEIPACFVGIGLMGGCFMNAIHLGVSARSKSKEDHDDAA